MLGGARRRSEWCSEWCSDVLGGARRCSESSEVSGSAWKGLEGCGGAGKGSDVKKATGRPTEAWAGPKSHREAYGRLGRAKGSLWMQDLFDSLQELQLYVCSLLIV